MNPKSLGLVIIGFGAAIIAIGLLVQTGWLAWFGRLPGDIRIERENMKVYVPIVSMLLVSVVLSLIAAVVRWGMRE
jgi:hypothetical protein